MKEKFFVAIAWLFTCFHGFSQGDIPEFGNITPAELAADACPFEKDAPAVYLLNYSKTEFETYYDGSYDLVTKRRIRIKIITQKGFDYASISIPHLGNKHTSKIRDIEAFIYTLDANGAIVKNKVDRKDIFRENVSKRNDLNIVKFTFPGLKAGCIIEYRYEHLEKNTYDIDPWLIQNSIPVALSYCEVNFPSASLLDYRIAGQLAFTKNNYREWPIDSTKEKFKKTFLVKEIPSFKTEPLMSSMIDNLERIEFSLNPRPTLMTLFASTTDKKWLLISERFMTSFRFGMQLDVNLPGTEQLIDSVKSIKTKKDQINAIYSYVKKQLSWDKHQTLYPYDINEIWKAKTGNSADLNLIILNLLKKAGIDCYPLLISTRENGKTDPLFAHMSQFNGLDVLVLDSANYYVLDASSTNPSCLIPPLNVLNRDVFLVIPHAYKWVNINETRPLIKDSVYINAALDKDGLITGEAVTTSFHYSRNLRLEEEKETNKSTNDLLSNELAELKTDSTWLVNKNEETLPLTAHARFRLPLNNTSNFYFLNPYIFNSIRKNPLTDSTRSTNIDFMCNQQYTQTINLNLPGNIVMETVPGSITIRMIDSSMIYSRKVIQRGSVLWIENEFRIDKSAYTPDEYPAVWQFFKKVYALLAEQIVLQKKE
jgi:hypothetical protein